jgi:transcriptional regulator GlxA family with amidase domain
MIKVYILGFDYAFATSITGMIDLLSTAGTAWNFYRGQTLSPKFQVQLASRDGQPIRCLNQVCLHAHCRFDQIRDAQVLMVPSIGGEVDTALARNPELIALLQHHEKCGTRIGSNCTGAFFLARAGILNGRRATTHWALVEKFRRDYPFVELVPEQLITSDGQIFCSGGGSAWFDLALFLIEQYFDHATAIESAKAMVLDSGRRQTQQNHFAVQANKYHHDERILEIQQWIDKHFHAPITIQQLAQRFALSPRSLIRRFRSATGEPPLAYMQTVRIANAQHLLESSPLTISEITRRSGYEDVSSFSRLFKRRLGWSPTEYRLRFSKQREPC